MSMSLMIGRIFVSQRYTSLTKVSQRYIHFISLSHTYIPIMESLLYKPILQQVLLYYFKPQMAQ